MAEENKIYDIGYQKGREANGHPPNHHNRDEKTNEENKEKENGGRSCLSTVSNAVTQGLEKTFSRLGYSIGCHPQRYIIVCAIAAGLSGVGFLELNEVTVPEKLWVPKDAQVIVDKNWIDNEYPSLVRREQIMAVKDNILTPSGLAALLDIYQEAELVSTPGGTTLETICVKAGQKCIVYSILELWSYDNTTIRSLTQNQILDGVNTVTMSPVDRHPIDLSVYLGKMTTNATGYIVSAEAAAMTWLLMDMGNNIAMEWELQLIEIGTSGHADLTDTFVYTKRSRRDASSQAVDNDTTKLSFGYTMVIIFVYMVLGKLNFMEQRIWLTLGGFICVGMSIAVSIGLSSALQQDYGPLHSILPFLLLGIGVDDMFVIMGSLNNLKPEEQQLDIPHKMSAVLKHAGVSITVTSFTDFMAFMIGATTIIPALRSFCIYAGIGVLALYVFQAMFFTACLTIDLYRIAAKRDGCFCCIKHPSPPYQVNAFSQRQFLPFVFKHGLARIIVKLGFQICAVLIALGLFGVNIYGLIQLEQYFDPVWFQPSDSHPSLFKAASAIYFPQDGEAGYVYCGPLDYWNRKSQLEALDKAMSTSEWINNGTTDSWFSVLEGWLNTTREPNVTKLLDSSGYPISEEAFYSLADTMSREYYKRTRANIVLDNNKIVASRFPYQHPKTHSTATEVDAMDSLRNLVKDSGFSETECFPYARFYLIWETNKIIQKELYRNIGLALACVFVVTLILIANIRTSIFVFGGVLMTLIDVAGTIHFWGLTIDTVTTIVLILAIGLAVDYSAHMGHMFMTIKGDRITRLKETIGEMGPPVFYGGFSTFLAIVVLSLSNSYAFKTFFKVNFLVVLYGLFHGLIIVPILLSWMGPEPYASADQEFRHHHPPPPDVVMKIEGKDNLAFTVTENGSVKPKSPAVVSTVSNHSNDPTLSASSQAIGPDNTSSTRDPQLSDGGHVEAVANEDIMSTHL